MSARTQNQDRKRAERAGRISQRRSTCRMPALRSIGTGPIVSVPNPKFASFCSAFPLASLRPSSVARKICAASPWIKRAVGEF